MSLRISNLSKRFDNKWVFRDISLEVNNGEVLGIFGPSGAGKTVLINTIAGSTSASGGSIRHNGDDVTEISCDKRGFHFPKISNESIWRTIFKSNDASRLADGEGQKAALEAALLDGEDVLLLDNSFCEMDEPMRREAFERLRATVKEKNLAVLFASSDFSAILSLCDRVAVMANGYIQQTGAPHEVYEHPESAIVARITGHNNLFEARRLSSSKAEIPEFQTLVGEHRIFTQKTGRNALGALNQNILLGIRPEQISISFGASFPEDNLLKATVKSVRFMGPTTLIELDANGLKLEALVLRLVGLNPGDECMVGLPPDRIQFFVK
jgi:ABC-type Fe3+/spermidine/putrescine transport system ATPase subunit